MVDSWGLIVRTYTSRILVARKIFCMVGMDNQSMNRFLSVRINLWQKWIATTLFRTYMSSMNYVGATNPAWCTCDMVMTALLFQGLCFEHTHLHGLYWPGKPIRYRHLLHVCYVRPSSSGSHEEARPSEFIRMEVELTFILVRGVNSVLSLYNATLLSDVCKSVFSKFEMWYSHKCHYQRELCWGRGRGRQRNLNFSPKQNYYSRFT